MHVGLTMSRKRIVGFTPAPYLSPISEHVAVSVWPVTFTAADANVTFSVSVPHPVGVVVHLHLIQFFCVGKLDTSFIPIVPLWIYMIALAVGPAALVVFVRQPEPVAMEHQPFEHIG
jgi:hypothetical protein